MTTVYGNEAIGSFGAHSYASRA